MKLRAQYFLLGCITGIDMALAIILPWGWWSYMLCGWVVVIILWVAYADRKYA